jgi:hypothetical protein
MLPADDTALSSSDRDKLETGGPLVLESKTCIDKSDSPKR